MLKNVLGVIVGLFVGLVMLGLVEFAAQLLFAPKEGLDINDPVAMKTLQENQPGPKLVMMLFAWVLGPLAGAWVACELGDHHRVKAGMAVGVIMLLMGIRVVMGVKHPLWFSVLSQLVVLPSAYAGTRITLFIEGWHRSKRPV
jgi:hypothetical protein